MCFLEQQPKNDRGNHRNDQLDIKTDPCKVKEFSIIDDHHGQDRKELDDDLEQIRKGGGLTPMIGLVNFIWAVELMGRNSVSPSTMDRMMAWMIFIFGYAWVLGLPFRKIAKISTTNPARIRIGAT